MARAKVKVAESSSRSDLSLLPAAQEHILAQEDGKNRLLRAVTGLSQAFALAVPHEAALVIRVDWTLRDNVRAQLRVYVKRILRKYGYPPDKLYPSIRLAS